MGVVVRKPLICTDVLFFSRQTSAKPVADSLCPQLANLKQINKIKMLRLCILESKNLLKSISILKKIEWRNPKETIIFSSRNHQE